MAERYEVGRTGALALVALVSFTVLVVILFVAALRTAPFGVVKPLGEWYLYNAYNEWSEWTSMAPNAVMSIVWDYRGCDTMYETTVFFLAAVGVCCLFRTRRGVVGEDEEKERAGMKGLTVIPKTVARLVFIVIIAVVISITLRGHFSPGGGFQGGAAMAIAAAVVLVAFSREYLTKHMGFTVRKMLRTMTLGVVLIWIVAMIPVIFSFLTGAPAFFLQNQHKPFSPYAFPENVFGLHVGTFLPIDVGEFLNVMSGFTIIVLLFTVPEIYFKVVEKKEVK